jgi:hypothetical protein
VKYFWVYLPDIDEAGTVVQAESFVAAFRAGCAALYPDDGVEVQVHELGESQTFVAGEDNEEIEVDPEVEATAEWLRTIADMSEEKIAVMLSEAMSSGRVKVHRLAQAAHIYREDPKLGPMFTKVKEALLNGS